MEPARRHALGDLGSDFLLDLARQPAHVDMQPNARADRADGRGHGDASAPLLRRQIFRAELSTSIRAEYSSEAHVAKLRRQGAH